MDLNPAASCEWCHMPTPQGNENFFSKATSASAMVLCGQSVPLQFDPQVPLHSRQSGIVPSGRTKKWNFHQEFITQDNDFRSKISLTVDNAFLRGDALNSEVSLPIAKRKKFWDSLLELIVHSATGKTNVDFSDLHKFTNLNANIVSTPKIPREENFLSNQMWQVRFNETQDSSRGVRGSLSIWPIHRSTGWSEINRTILFSVNDLEYLVFTLTLYVVSWHVCDLDLLTSEGSLFHVCHGFCFEDIMHDLVCQWQMCSASRSPLIPSLWREVDEDTAESEHKESWLFLFGHSFSVGNVTRI